MPSRLPAGEVQDALSSIRLDAKRDVDILELAKRAAIAGAMGGAVTGNVARATISYEDWLSDIKSRPVIFRGLRGDVVDPTAALAGSRFKAAYGSPNPAAAATYATPSTADLDKYGGRFEGPRNRRTWRSPSGGKMTFGDIAEGGSVYPLRAASKRDVLRYVDEDFDNMAEVLAADKMGRHVDLLDVIQNPATPADEKIAAAKAIDDLAIESEFNTLATKTPKGRLISVAPSTFPDTWAEYPPLDPSHLSAHPTETYSWRDPSAVDLAGKPFQTSETSEILRAAAKRLGYPEEGLSNKEFAEAVSEHESGVTPYSKLNRNPDDKWAYRRSEYTDKARKLIDEVQNDPRFQPSKRARAIQFLKGAAKEAVRPKNILTDAAIGSLVGPTAAILGYEMNRPRSAGIFTPQSEDYKGASTQEDILAIAAAKEAENEARRQQYFEEALATGASVPTGARISDLAEYLGPIR